MDYYLEDLPEDSLEGFLALEERVRSDFHPYSSDTHIEDRMEYVQWLRSYALEHHLEWVDSVVNPPLHDEAELLEYWVYTSGIILWWLKRYQVRLAKQMKSVAIPESDLVVLNIDYRAEIHDHLGKIRKIVRAIDLDEGIRERIFDRVNALAKEIDRERTPMASFTDAFLVVTKALGDGAENLEPVVKQFERIAAVFGRAKDSQDTKQIEGPKPKSLPAPKD